MFAADARTLAKIEPVIRRVLIVDPHMPSARLLADLMKGMGAREVMMEQDEKAALAAARDLEPGIVFTEHAGPQLDGESLTRRLRRSNLSCRRAPVIMVTATATAASIKGARDCGVHEYLRKPFTSGDLFKRVEIVTMKPRDWIEAVGYVGPDRRRFNSGEYAGPQKRSVDKPKSAAEVTLASKDQAMRILAAALDQFDSDPMQAVRAVREQAVVLKALGMKVSDTRLIIATSALESALAAGPPTKGTLAGPINALVALADSPLAALRKAG